MAVVDGQTTVMYLRTAVDGSWLVEPANATCQPIKPTDFLEVLGAVVGAFRNYRR